MAKRPNQAALRNMPKAKNPLLSFSRLMKFVFQGKWLYVAVILVCIIVSSFATTYSASFIGSFIDEIVIPLKEKPIPISHRRSYRLGSSPSSFSSQSHLPTFRPGLWSEFHRELYIKCEQRCSISSRVFLFPTSTRTRVVQS